MPADLHGITWGLSGPMRAAPSRPEDTWRLCVRCVAVAAAASPSCCPLWYFCNEGSRLAATPQVQHLQATAAAWRAAHWIVYESQMARARPCSATTCFMVPCSQLLVTRCFCQCGCCKAYRSTLAAVLPAIVHRRNTDLPLCAAPQVNPVSSNNATTGCKMHQPAFLTVSCLYRSSSWPGSPRS